VDIQVIGSEIVVFGIGTGAAYIEGFGREDGKNHFRFTTAY
jgi:hypothetical protein